MATTPTTFSAALGTVLGAFPGGNYYHVITDHGNLEALWCGGSLGELGVQDTGGFMPGTLVVVLFQPGVPKGYILQAVAMPWSHDDADTPRHRLVMPQRTGFDPGDPQARAQGRLFMAELLGRYHGGNGVLGLQAGEWARTSPFGGHGLGVELFRTWLRGGPMAGLECWTDTQRTRLKGLDLELWSLGQEHLWRRRGNALEEIRRQALLPSEALEGAPARRLDLGGEMYRGWDTYVAPARQRPQPGGKATAALFHQHLGVDGTFVVSSASAILLERFYGIAVPEEHPAVTLVDKAPVFQAPEELSTIASVLDKPRDPGVLGEKAAELPFSWAQRVMDLIDDVVRLQGRDPVTRLPKTFVPTEDPVPGWELLEHATMWAPPPRAVPVLIDQKTGTRTIHYGRSTFALLPDGSVQVTDAHMGQILLAGGNVFVSAPRDIILAAGRNIVGVAGGALGLKARREVDLVSNDAQVTIKAEQQLSILGGNAGGGAGVLIESRAGGDLAVPGTGSDGYNGGILLKSAGAIQGYAGTQMALKSTGTMSLTTDPGATLVFSTNYILGRTSGGMILATENADTPYAFTPAAAIIPTSLLVAETMWSNMVYVDQSVLAMGSIAGASVGPIGDDKAIQRQFDAAKRQRAEILKLASTATATALKAFVDAWNQLAVSPDIIKRVGVSFLTSAQRGLGVVAKFCLPEPLWSIVGVKASGTWKEKPVLSPAGDGVKTAGFPGLEILSNPASYIRRDAAWRFDPRTGRVIPESDTVAPEPTLASIDGNLPYLEF